MTHVGGGFLCEVCLSVCGGGGCCLCFFWVIITSKWCERKCWVSEWDVWKLKCCQQGYAKSNISCNSEMSFRNGPNSQYTKNTPRPGPNFSELAKHIKIRLIRIRLPAKMKGHLYHLWCDRYIAHFCSAENCKAASSFFEIGPRVRPEKCLYDFWKPWFEFGSHPRKIYCQGNLDINFVL